MRKRYKLAAATQSLWDYPLEEAIACTAECGFDGIEIVVLDPWLPLEFVRDRKKEIRRWIGKSGLEVAALTTITNFTQAEMAPASISTVRTLTDLGAEFGTAIVKISPGPPASGKASGETWNALAANMEQVAAYAEKRRVKLAVETHLNMLTDTLAGTRRLLELFRSPALGLTLDFCNIMVGRDDPEKAAREFAARTFLCHVKDGSLHNAGAPEWLPLGEGALDYPGILRTLHQSVYSGFLSLECLVKDHRYNQKRLGELGGAKGVLKHDRDALRRYLQPLSER